MRSPLHNTLSVLIALPLSESLSHDVVYEIVLSAGTALVISAVKYGPRVIRRYNSG